MLTILSDSDINQLPSNLPSDIYPNVQALISLIPYMPAMIRQSAQDSWHGNSDNQISSEDVFDEADGVHSFYHVNTIEDCVAVARFMSSKQSKPLKSTIYFFALPL